MDDMIKAHVLLDAVERWWLRFNRERCLSLVEEHRAKAEQQARLFTEAMARYQFWIDRERLRGFPWRYDDRDITWKIDLLLTVTIAALCGFCVAGVWALS